MKTRNYDTLYCGVDEMKIKSSTPIIHIDVLKRYAYYQKERTYIYELKEVLKKESPWTNDTILRDYKFTNTRRELDRESKYLINEIINSDISYNDKILNCIVFRIINKSETMRLLGAPFRFTEWTKDIFEEMRTILDSKSVESPEYVFFSAAYILGGVKGTLGREVEKIQGAPEPNMVLRMLKYVYFLKDELLQAVNSAKTQQEVFEGLQQFKGFARFIAYQQFVDFTYIPEFPFSENEFVISGPGCDRGINWICEDKDGLNYEEFMFWFRDNIEILCEENDIEWKPEDWFHFLNPDDRNWGLMQIENSFCEFDKYSRTLLAGKRPKQKYKTIKKELEQW